MSGQMTPEAATALRVPFPAESVGKLPKPYKSDSPKGQCNECGGWHGLPAVHLDYVGHAAVTDRLLAVDPGWSWEPLALDAAGLPALDRSGNLWIRLTILGVTRIGVGDGKSAKECIGDAIRNAGMRFGIALDLWAKEDLVEFRRAVEAVAQVNAIGEFGQVNANDPATPESAPAEPISSQDPEEPMTAKTRGGMFALLGEKGIPEDAHLAGINQITGKDYTSRGDLTEADAQLVIAALRKMPTPPKADQ